MLDRSVALLNATQMTQADRLTVASGISEIRLMENAGAGGASHHGPLESAPGTGAVRPG